MLDLAIIASTVVGKYLVPVLKSGWDHFFDDAKDKVGAAAAKETQEIASGIWARVQAAFGADQRNEAVLEQFETMPEVAAPLIEQMLRQLLEKDTSLAGDLARLLDRTVDGAHSGAQIIADTVLQVNAQHAHVESGGVIAARVDGGIHGGSYGSNFPPAGPAGVEGRR